MASHATMVFSACRPDGMACVEYSWVPTGQRHVIQLGNQPADAQTSPAPQVTHVQVYRLRNANFGLPPAGWQFPRTPAQPGRFLAAATIHVIRDRAYGFAVYDDGSMALPDDIQLVPITNEYDCGHPSVHDQ